MTIGDHYMEQFEAAMDGFRQKVLDTIGASDTEQRVSDLGLDSLDFLDMIVELEKAFNIKLTADEVVECKTVADLAELVHSKC